MNPSEWAIRGKTFTLVLTLLTIGAGIVYYDKLGRLEDPEFTIKDAQIITFYPGATPTEVEEEVTEVLETAIQELAQLKEIKSESKAGVSIITPSIKDQYGKETLPQIWDELRRKVNDAQRQLPPGVMPSIVYDDYGDVFGVMIAITGKGYTYKELDDYADFLRRELLQVDDVAKITKWGVQQEQVFVEISRYRMAQMGLSISDIYNTLEKQNLVAPAGSVRVGNEYIRISPTGGLNSVAEIAELMIRGSKTKKLIRLSDIATVTRGYVTPPTSHLRYNKKPAIGLGISTISGGNVVTMGQALEKRMLELQAQTPVGMKLHYMYYQGGIVAKSVNGFIINLFQAIVIVIVVLMLFMGMRSGLLIGAILLLTVCSTIFLMYLYEINLQRISLGALIIALGMLVDNAIVIVEGMLIRIQQGKDHFQAAKEVVQQSMWPLFGATAIAVLAFAAIGLSDDSTGEFLRSLFQVMLMSLGMSWVIAITVTPLLGTMFLKAEPTAEGEEIDPYKGMLFQLYRKFLVLCLRLRWLTVTTVVGLLVAAMYGFTFLEDSFFPDSTSSHLMVHVWLPQGTDIRKTSDDVKQIEKFILKQDGVTAVSSFVGAGASRFMLVYTPEKENSAYAFLLVEVDDYRIIKGLSKTIDEYLAKHHINTNPRIEKVRLGPGGGFPIEARVSGPDPNVLRTIADKIKTIMRADGNARGVREDWRERVKIIEPVFSENQARRAGITRTDLASAFETNFSGTKIGIYREDDDLIPIMSRAPELERVDVNNLPNVQVWSAYGEQVVPVKQIVSAFNTSYEDAIIHRREKRPTITVQTEPKVGNASVVLARIKPKIEAIPLPVGYNLEWGGEYEDSKDAQAGLIGNIPPTLILMILISIGLFNRLRQPLIIWMTVPLAIIGVTVGLLATNESFGFMALLGFLSLVGMLIKNAIVLIDEIDLQIASGPDRFEGLVSAAVSRMRPVMMAAVTTILGMIPLLSDVFFFGMAVTIMSGLAFATVLTLIIVPVFYAILFRVR